MNNVKLVAATQPLVKTDDQSRLLTFEEFVAYTARVSNPSNQLNTETSSKLLKYCIKNEHWSIFEQVSLTFEIMTSRAIAQQILRHRSFCYQEFSQRYATALNGIVYEARRQDVKNRQNSIDDLPHETKEWFLEKQEQVWDMTKSIYDEAIEKGIAKECARFVLPLNTETKLYMTGPLRSWIHYINLRTKPGTQKEHMDIAQKCKEEIVSFAPTIASACGWTDE